MASAKVFYRSVKPGRQWIESIRGSSILEAKKQILCGILELAGTNANGLVTRAQLYQWLEQQYAAAGEEVIGKSRLSQLIKELTEEGAFKRRQLPEENTTLFLLTENIADYLLEATQRIRDKKKASRRGEAAQIRKDAAMERLALMALDGAEYLEGTPAIYYGERLMHGILDAAVRSGRADRRREIRTRYALPAPIKGTREWIDIRTQCLSGEDSQIFELADLSVVMALNSRFVEHIQRKYGPQPNLDRVPNLFVFDILDLCEELGVAAHRRDVIAARLRRLRDTVFQIDVSQAPEFRQAFGYGERSLVEYQYLTEFEIATEQVVEDLIQTGNTESLEALERDPIFDQSLDMFGGTEAYIDTARMQVVRQLPRHYYVRFNSRQFQALVLQARTQRFIVHPALKLERLGFVYRFYNWCKAYIGVRPRQHRAPAVQFLLSEFHDVCLPSATYATFVTDITLMAQKYRLADTEWDDSGVNKSLIHGYYLELDCRPGAMERFLADNPRARQPKKRPGPQRACPVVTMYRDVQDPLIGDNSAHNQALRQQQFDALAQRSYESGVGQ